MIAFPGMLVNPATEAGIKVPENAEDFEPKDFPHWHVYLAVQLGAPMPTPTSHWDNAKLIADIPDDKIMLVTYEELLEKGLQVGNSSMYN